MTDSRRPGRPPLDPSDPSVDCVISLPLAEYEALLVRAYEEDVSVPEIIRRDLWGKKLNKSSG